MCSEEIKKFITEKPDEIIGDIINLNEHYDFIEENTNGANGYLFCARNRISEKVVAIKFYAGEPGDRQHDEPRHLAQIEAENVLGILDSRRVDEEWAFFVTPWCSEGDLDALIARTPTTHEAIDTALGIVRGISELHSRSLLHRDLKPGNIVLEGGVPKIADFGSVRLLPDGNDYIKASKHSILYRPPESFSEGLYSAQGDIYQLGLVTFQLLGGYLPYQETAYLNAREKKVYQEIDDPIDKTLYVDSCIERKAKAGKIVNLNTLPPWISRSGKNIIRSLIATEPKKRCRTIAEAASALSRLRAVTPNWGYYGKSARITKPDRTIELRLTSQNGYAAFQNKGGGFRRIPNSAEGTLEDLVATYT